MGDPFLGSFLRVSPRPGRIGVGSGVGGGSVVPIVLSVHGGGISISGLIGERKAIGIGSEKESASLGVGDVFGLFGVGRVVRVGCLGLVCLGLVSFRWSVHLFLFPALDAWRRTVA